MRPRPHFLAHERAGQRVRITRRIRRIPAARQALDLRVEIGVEKIPNAHTTGTGAGWIDDPMEVREPSVVGPALHHVPNVHDEMAFLRCHRSPPAVARTYLQTARNPIDRENR